MRRNYIEDLIIGKEGTEDGKSPEGRAAVLVVSDIFNKAMPVTELPENLDRSLKSTSLDSP